MMSISPSQMAHVLLLGKLSNTECPYPTLRGDSALATNKESYLIILLYEM